MFAARPGAAAPPPPAVTQLLDGLLRDVQAAVRPALEGEAREAAKDGSIGDRHIRLRREAEALLLAAERACTPAFRQQHAELWPALAAALDRRLTDASHANLYGNYDDGCMLWSRLEERAGAQGVAVASSLCSPYLNGAVSTGDKLVALLTKLSELEKVRQLLADPDFQAFQGSRASTRRPPLASKLARFDASFDAAAAAAAATTAPTAGAALLEARCEVTVYESFPTGQLAAGADILAFTGGFGWKGREPFLMVGRIDTSSGQPAAAATAAADASAEDGRPEKRRRRGQQGKAGGERSWRQRLHRITTGFYDTGYSVAVDPERGLVWAAGGEDRIKGFAIDASPDDERRGCRYTLSGSERVLGVVGGRVLAAVRGGGVAYWDIALLTPQRRWVAARELDPEEGDNHEDEAAHITKFGCKVLDMLQDTMNELAYDKAEVTYGDEPHGHLQLQAPKLEVLQMEALGATGGGAEPQQLAAVLEDSNSVWVFDWPSSRLSSLLTGHVGNVGCLSTCPTLPHTLVAGSNCGKVRVWDVRTAACTHVLSTHGDKAVQTVALAEHQGVPFCFSAQLGGKSILAWDLRAPGRCLYELATGNNDVVCLQWHAPSRSLFASTKCNYQDRCGHMHDQGTIDGYRWPDCMHRPTDFGHAWDARGDMLARYAFKDDPDLEVLPEEAEPDPDAEELSEEERRTFYPLSPRRYW